jgi:DNA-binding NarL/FixJ family response regulator
MTETPEEPLTDTGGFVERRTDLEAAARVFTVLIVDDHPMLRRIVALSCNELPNLKVVGEAPDGPTALELFAETQPDVVVLDLGLPGGMSGFDVARRIKRDRPATKVLILSGRLDQESLLDSMRAAVDGYLEKTSRIETIAAAIEAVARGRNLFTEDQERLAYGQLRTMVRRAREISRVEAKLTPREIEVLQLISEGLTTRQMASRLTMSQRTVESHISKLYKKMGVASRVQAVAKASQLGLLSLEGA